MHLPCLGLSCKKHAKVQGLFCLTHWRMVPVAVKNRIEATYRVGQNVTFEASQDWKQAVANAEQCVHGKQREIEDSMALKRQ